MNLSTWMSRVSPIWLAVGVALLGTPVLQALEPSESASETTELQTGDQELFAALKGVWKRSEDRENPDQIRFYYFHGDGNGLYRYGKRGHTQTHSFNYSVAGGQLEIGFRHFGEPHRTRVSLRNLPSGGKSMRFSEDPRDPGAVYVSEPAPATVATKGVDATSDGIGGRIWLEMHPLTAGGYEWLMYQFNPAAIDGRGVGWFHRGTFDNWTTEAFSYRVEGTQLQLRFDVARRTETTEFEVSVPIKGKRALLLARDPRDFWHRHRYEDVGRSFGSFGDLQMSAEFWANIAK